LKAAAREDTPALCFRDESGFAPTLPGTYPWARERVRPTVAYEAPQGRRVNVLGAWAPLGSQPQFAYQSRTGKLDRAAFLALLWHGLGGLATPVGALPADYRPPRRCVGALDNYPVHRSQAVAAALPGRRAAGIARFDLPPYSPDLHPSEGLWRHVKHEELPVRSQTSAAALQAAVDEVLSRHAATPPRTTQNLPEAA
jgi:hypothetical protein